MLKSSWANHFRFRLRHNDCENKTTITNLFLNTP